MKPYTVLLLRPDYIADNYGEYPYMAHVEAETVEDAQVAAQKAARECDYPAVAYMGEDAADFEEFGDVSIEDYAVLMVIEGHHNDIKGT